MKSNSVPLPENECFRVIAGKSEATLIDFTFNRARQTTIGLIFIRPSSSLTLHLIFTYSRLFYCYFQHLMNFIEKKNRFYSTIGLIFFRNTCLKNSCRKTSSGCDEIEFHHSQFRLRRNL